MSKDNNGARARRGLIETRRLRCVLQSVAWLGIFLLVKAERRRFASMAGLLGAFLLTGGIASAGPKAYIGAFADNAVSVVDLATAKTVATIPVAAGPHGLVISPDDRTVYVTGDGSSALDVIDTASDRVTKTIEVGKAPNGIALSRDGGTLLVAVYGEDRIVLVDTKTQAITGSIAVPKPHTIALRGDDQSAYVTSQEPGRFGIAVVDLAARKLDHMIPLEKTPRDGEFGPEGKAFYFTEAGIAAIQVLDPASDTVVAEIPTGVSPHFVSVFPGMSDGVAVVQGTGELLLFDPKSNQALRHVAVGKQPHWATVSADRKNAYVTNEGANTLSIVDLASGKVADVEVGHAPRKIVVQSGAAQRADAGPGVTIDNFAFTPQRLAIRSGERVTWRNADGSPHTVTFKDGSAGSQALSPGSDFARTFDQPGSYDYFCSFHPYMTATVVVAAKE